ncbi:hypothetical protein BGX29_010081 [Mortierella sp. GBA35]|nr:hypothetical protein BGX29_010081 [Mortierella sp. GBA35]
MFIKSIVASLAVAATVLAQTPGVPNHIYFTDPVSAPTDTSRIYQAGKNITFSWSSSCTTGDWIAPDPTKVPVQLVNSTDSNAVIFLKEVTQINCSGAVGNNYWVVPDEWANSGIIFSLRMMLGSQQAFSGKFQIKSDAKPAPGPSGAGPNPTGTPDATKGSGASVVAPVLSGAAAVAAGALMFL